MDYTFNKDTKALRVFTDNNFLNRSSSGLGISIAIITCDKDVGNLPKILYSIKQNISGNYEVILVDNCVEKTCNPPDYVKHIKTNDNLYPFASRIIAAEKAEGNYIWFIDGDDDICLNINANAFNTIDHGIFIFSENANFQDGSILSMPLRTLYRSKVTDNSLHNVLINKNIYKQFVSLPKYKIFYFEDTLLYAYAINCSRSIFLFGKQAYVYNKNSGGNLYKIRNSTDKLKQYLVGYQEALRFIEEHFEGIAKETLYDKIGAGLDYNSNIWELPNIKNYYKYCKFATSYLIDNYRSSSNSKIKDFDIIYIYYGSDYKEELKILEATKKNIIVIDMFSTINETLNVPIIKGEDIKECLKDTISHIKSKNVLLLESYKSFSLPDKIDSLTTIYDESIDGKLEYFNPLSRNNVIFSKKDFEELLTLDFTFGSLSNVICKFLNGRPNVAYSNTIITTAQPFEESELNIFFINFGKYLETDAQAQYCYNNVSTLFSNAKITVFNEESAKEYIDKSPLTKKIMDYRQKNNDLITYENDIIRLLISQSMPKSIYLDLDVVIKNKTEFLKKLSIYPNFCPVSYYKGDSLIFHNETMWTLGKSEFVQKNIKFYNGVTDKTLLENKFTYWNGGISNILGNRFGFNINKENLSILDMSGELDTSYLLHHFCGSRYRLNKTALRIGIYNVPDNLTFSDVTTSDNFADLRSLQSPIVYLVRPYEVLDGFLHQKVDAMDITSIETYIDLYNTLQMLKLQISNKNITFISPNFRDTKHIITIVDNTTQIAPTICKLRKQYKNNIIVNAISLDHIGFYLSDKYTPEEIKTMDKAILKSELKKDVISKNPYSEFIE